MMLPLLDQGLADLRTAAPMTFIVELDALFSPDLEHCRG
jgi:hypothetical protein